MTESPKQKSEEPEVDPEEGDAILRRMLRSVPKQHREMIAERKGKRPSKPKKGKK
jgi:hypothetical protein